MLQSLRHLLGLTPKVIIVPASRKSALDVRERMELREWLNLPTTQKALAVMEARHPGTNIRGSTVARSEWDERAAVAMLNRIRGWESYRDALLQIAEEPRQMQDVEESYPSQTE